MHDECFQSNSLQIVPPSQNHVRFNSDIVAYPSQSISAINRNDLEQQRVGNKNSQQEIIEYMKMSPFPGPGPEQSRQLPGPVQAHGGPDPRQAEAVL